ncbi:unnamed protein product [Paramecium sonneborni]|uniref:Uncharacterized protein n=1 Tax=Paramecium sonneborni TaxID=65129 RepID=A0A8S1L356_9CILI|nr:unnamed protein product [Paramecium sonneborni]
MNLNQENPHTLIVNLINNQAITNKNQELNINKIIENLLKQTLNLSYDGPTYCQLTGQFIGNKKLIKLKVNKDLHVNVLDQSLIDLIQNHCFIDGRFERCFSTINNVQFIMTFEQKTEFSNPTSLEITDDILKLVYGEERFIQMMEEIQEFYQLNQNFQDSLTQNQLVQCPKTQKYILFNDGFNIQGKMYSLEGALTFLNQDQGKLFDHQKHFLQQYQGY